MSWSNYLAVFLCSVGLVVSGCGEPPATEVDVGVTFLPASVGATASRVELYFVESCANVTRGYRPFSSAATVVVNQDGTTSGLGPIDPGTFGVHALALDAECNVVAANTCSEHAIKIGTDMTFGVTLSAVGTPIPSPCTNTLPDGGGPDGDVDATVDGGPDATVDAGMDAGPDATVDAGTIHDATYTYNVGTTTEIPLAGAPISQPFRATLTFDSPHPSVSTVKWYIVSPGGALTQDKAYRSEEYAPYNSTGDEEELMPLNAAFNGLNENAGDHSGNTFRFSSGQSYEFAIEANYTAGGSDVFRAQFTIQ